MDNEENRRLSYDLVVLSARLVRTVRQHTPDIPSAGPRLMTLLDERGPTTIGHLAVADRCTQPTMSGLVKNLASRGWVERHSDPRDARATLVSLSDEGRRVLADLRERSSQVIAQRIGTSGHSAAEVRAAVALLTDVLADEELSPA